MRLNQLLLISESKDEVIFQLESGVRFKVSPIDKMFVIGQSWGLSGKGYLYVTSRHSDLFGKYLHVLIAKAMNLVESDHTDHRDRNPLNCHRNNLRSATRSQNQWNRKCRVDSSTGIKGISYLKRADRFTAEIWIAGKKIYLGCYSNIEQAIVARQKAAIHYQGEFVNHG